MRRTLREIRRAPARILTTVFALALAVAAIGVFAIPTVATSSLRTAAARDGLPEIVIGTTDTGATDVVAVVSGVDGVERVEPQVETTIAPAAGGLLTLVGHRLADQRLDVLRVDEGRLPARPGEVLVTAGVAPIGTSIPVTGERGVRRVLTVVGVGGTSFWSGEELAFADLDTAAALAGLTGVNRIVVDTTGSSEADLRATVDRTRDLLAAEGIAMTYLPVTIEDGTHPIESDIEQISSLIGLLGIVAGVVALVLLGSTTNTLITERSREVAVMRALGAPPRRLRRRLRRLAVGIALAAVVVGVPLGVVVSNVIARMVLEEFIGLTPGLAVSVPVMVASAAFALVGARLVAARAARRVTRRPLAEALRDRDGNPFGRRPSERAMVRLRAGRPLGRAAARNGVHRRARSLATLAQITAAVAGLMIIASLATTVNAFNAAELDPWRWESETWVSGPGLDIDARLVDGDPRSETAIEVGGEVAGWEVDVVGLVPGTAMIDRRLDAGGWPAGPGEAVVSTGFAQRTGLAVGDAVEVRLASGDERYEVTGLHPHRGRALFVDRDGLAADLGAPGRANRVLSLDASPATVPPGFTGRALLGDLTDEHSARDAILLIFSAIGFVVVSVAGLAVASGLAVNAYERRHEFAAIQALGGRRRHVFRVVAAELLPLTVAGIGLGLVAGYVGAEAIIASFETSNAVEIGFVFAGGAIPLAATVVVLGSLVLGRLVVGRVTRRPVALTLRGAG